MLGEKKVLKTSFKNISFFLKILIQITFSQFLFATDIKPLSKNNQYHVFFMLCYRSMTEECLKNIFSTTIYGFNDRIGKIHCSS